MNAKIQSRALHPPLVLFMLGALTIFGGCAPTESAPPKAESGLLDLRGWDFESDGIASLNGQWEFYWGQLLTPADFMKTRHPRMTGWLTAPRLWNEYGIEGSELGPEGFATLRLEVRIDPDAPLLALNLRGVISAYRLWLDEKLVVENGVVGTSRESESPGFGRKIVFFQPCGSHFRLTLQISNHHDNAGGLVYPLLLGAQPQITRGRDHERLSAVAIAGLFLFMGFYHLVLYGFRRRDRSTLYFGIYCMLWLTNSVMSYAHSWLVLFLWPDAPTWLIFRIDMISYFSTLPLIALFFRSMFPDEVPASMPRLAIGLAAVFTIYLLPPPAAGLRQMASNLPKLYHLAAVVFIGWSACCLIRAWIRKRDGAGLILMGFLLMAMVGANDIFHDLRVIRTGYFMPFGLLLFIICQSCALARRFSRAFATSEKLSGELAEKNIALAKMDQLKDEFLANTSHELRTPLSGIVGITESLLAGAWGQLSTEVRRNLDMVAGSGRRLTALVNDILDFSRLRKGDVALRLKSVDARATADVVITIATPLARTRRLELINAIPHDLPWVKADEDRLQQIFYNLLGNAIKFSDRGRISVGGRPTDHGVELCVKDQGAGIPDERQKAIFEPFEQADAGAERSRQGVGLGLAITRNLVQLHGGSLAVESRVGRGSTFRFTLPGADPPPEPETSKSAPAIELSAMTPDPGIVTPPERPESDPITDKAGDEPPRPRVLVVDDEPVNLQVVVNHLHLDGLSVQTAQSGPQALRLLETELPDLVLLDIMMPNMTGYEVCRRLRQAHSASRLPVVMLTAKNRVSDLVEGFKAGANDYVAKPFARDELSARVQNQLKLKQAYQTLAENIRLKKELAHRERTELDLRLMQRRLGLLLDAVDDAVIAVNDADEISFCNAAGKRLLGCEPDELLGRTMGTLFDAPSSDSLRALWAAPGSEPADGAPSLVWRRLDLTGSDGARRPLRVMATPLDLDVEQLQVLIMRPAEDPGGAPNPPVAAVIDELNWHQSRLRGVEETLNGLLPRLMDRSPDVLTEIRAIDRALESVGKALITDQARDDRRQLAVTVMQLSVDYWREATDEDKFELARRSGLWKVYTNRDGWRRAQTLDKYLSYDAFPKRPRWSWISDTAVYVLTTCDKATPRRDHLEAALARLRLARA